MVDIQSAIAEIRQEKKEETTGRKYSVQICYAGQPWLISDESFYPSILTENIYIFLCSSSTWHWKRDI